jgi:formylmethanofuran dehydrogenase subunit E
MRLGSFLVILSSIALLAACQKDNEEFLQELDKCPSDGINFSIRCKNGQEKIETLGHGKFLIINESESDLANNYCGEKTSEIEIDINLKNSHYEIVGRKRENGVIIKHQKSVKDECRSVGQFLSLKQFVKLRISSISISEPTPPVDDF